MTAHRTTLEHMTIPFYKAQAVGNDFLFSWIDQLPEPWREAALREFEPSAVKIPAPSADPLSEAARALCHRHTGVGADGWYLMRNEPEADLGIRLFNSDGSRAELSGNGTRCAAAVLLCEGRPVRSPGRVSVKTGSGVKQLRLAAAKGNEFLFEMEMGTPHVAPGDLSTSLPLASGPREATILNVGNPQCALAVPHFDFDWKALGAEIEGHPLFPNRTNVSFYRPVGPRAIEARFYERGAGPTLSSGTGSTGAAAAAVLRRMVEPELDVVTEAGVMKLRWDHPPSGPIFLEGPAEVTARGEYYGRKS